MITDQIASRSGKDFSSNQASAGKNGSKSGDSVTSVGDSRCHLYGLAVDGTSQWGCCPSWANYRSEYTAITQTFLILKEILYTKFLQLLTRPKQARLNTNLDKIKFISRLRFLFYRARLTTATSRRYLFYYLQWPWKDECSSRSERNAFSLWRKRIKSVWRRDALVFLFVLLFSLFWGWMLKGYF